MGNSQKSRIAKHTMSTFSARKERLLEEHNTHVLNLDGADAAPMTEEEKKLELVLGGLVERDEIIIPTENFMTNGPRFEQSEIVQFLKPMPKGAHLHLHNVAAGSFEKLADFVLKQEDMYIWRAEAEPSAMEFGGTMTYGTLKYMSKEDLAGLSAEESKHWENVSKCTQSEIYELLTMPVEFESKESKKAHISDPWTAFQNLWNRVYNIMHAKPLYAGESSFLWTIFEDSLACGVTYLELRQTGCAIAVESSVYLGDASNGYKQISLIEYLRVFGDTLSLFKAKNPRFIGAKLIICSFKAQSNTEIHEAIKAVDFINKNEPDLANLIAGYDLVGQEDRLRPIEDYKTELEFARSCGIDLFLHAGETNGMGSQLYDAVILDSKRIGHAYDLINHPKLMQKVKDHGIVVECCPISNQGLGYVHDMRNHNARSLLNHGIKLAISSDDPAMFRYHDVSYDFATITKAWGLTLMQLKKLALDSFDGAYLNEEETKEAKEQFNKEWKQFVSESLDKFG